MLHQRLSGPAVDDLAAVVTQNTAAVLFELEFPGQRLNADGGPSAGQHDADAAAGRLLQCRLCARRDDFFGVGQGAVKVQRQNFILHGYSPGMQICVYCTLKWGIMQASCLPLWGRRCPAGPDEGHVCHFYPLVGYHGGVGPHQSVVGATDSFPRGGSLLFKISHF